MPTLRSFRPAPRHCDDATFQGRGRMLFQRAAPDPRNGILTALEPLHEGAPAAAPRGRRGELIAT